jgi:hypothetical protein
VLLMFVGASLLALRCATSYGFTALIMTRSAQTLPGTLARGGCSSGTLGGADAAIELDVVQYDGCK